MKLLLDTHALLWWLADDDRLGTRARALIEDPANDVLVSVASLWEIVVKVRVGKLEADVGEVAAAVVWLCSPQASFTNGHALTVDGGFVAQ